jgi:hypothetical protein
MGVGVGQGDPMRNVEHPCNVPKIARKFQAGSPDVRRLTAGGVT